MAISFAITGSKKSDVTKERRYLLSALMALLATILPLPIRQILSCPKHFGVDFLSLHHFWYCRLPKASDRSDRIRAGSGLVTS